MHIYVAIYFNLIFVLGYCDNCTGIKVDGNIRGSNEIVYKNFGDDLIIEADFPRVFGVCSFLARLNGSAARLQDHCEVQIDTLTCNCNHLTTNNTGVYVIHITVDTRVNKSTPEWCSNNVTIIVQSKAQKYSYIDIRMYSYVYNDIILYVGIVMLFLHTYYHVYSYTLK